MGLKFPCTSESLMGVCEAGHSKLVLWGNQSGEEGGNWVQDGGTRVPAADSCQCMAKTTTIISKGIILQLK